MITLEIDKEGLERVWRSLLTRKVEHSPSVDKSVMLKALRTGAGVSESIGDYLEGLAHNEISVLYEFSLAYDSHKSRKNSGQFFTPDDVAKEMALRARAIDDGSDWLDPCCGIGNLTLSLAKVQNDPALFLKTRMWLVDKDSLALLTAAVMLTTELGGGTKGVFTALRARSRCGDFLSSRLTKPRNIILNPPYVIVPTDHRFESYAAGDLYAYFIEHALETSRGIVAITPQSFTNGHKFRGLRKVLSDRLITSDIYCFDNVPDNIFRGVKFGSQNSNAVNSTRAAILVGTTDGVFSGQKHRTERQFKITPLLRWRASERQQAFLAMDDYLTEFEPSELPFPKIGPRQVDLFQKLQSSQRRLSDITTKRVTKYVLYIPTTPRYFITASKRALERASIRRLYFKSAKDRNLAYLLLNSNLAYWWWRVFDGGMSLSERTLMTIPIPNNFEVDNDLVKEVQISEKKNLVTKLNAGMVAENIKHPGSLIDRLTVAILGRDAKCLSDVRNNSIFQ